MSDLLGIGASVISVYQRALSTVSNNIANLGTDGYARQTTEIKQNTPQQAGRGYIGTGAYFDRVARQYDSFLEASLQQATSDLESEGGDGGIHHASSRFAWWRALWLDLTARQFLCGNQNIINRTRKYGLSEFDAPQVR